jgi:uncharacterized protein (UPF0276 family)
MNAAAPEAVPSVAGIGLRHPHYREMLARRPRLAFLEVHSENYFGAGGPPHHYLERLRADYPLSLHGVGLSLGSTDPLDAGYLGELRTLIRRYRPALVSDHLCWTSAGGLHANDLLPLPFNGDTARHVAARIRQVQDVLERRILVENTTVYVRYPCSDLSEWAFVNAILEEADCDLLLDVNNLYVNAVNHGFDPLDWLAAVPAERVGEIHLAGFDHDPNGLLVDTHGRPVHPPVWELYRLAIGRLGPRPTLIEWDAEIPALDVLLAEAARADAILEQDHHAARRVAA